MHPTTDTAHLLNQAHALLAQTFGAGAESFQGLLPNVQDAYLSAVSALVAQAAQSLPQAAPTPITGLPA